MIPVTRRELATRHASWAKHLAGGLAAAGMPPNVVSIGSVLFAGVAALAFAATPQVSSVHQAALLTLAAALIQLRLLCNLLDGMLAVEHGKQTATGVLYNDVPDRVADVVILIGAGMSIAPMMAGAALGGAAAIGALFTAYVRLLGAAVTGRQHFIGPMAKPHRMFVLTIASLAGAVQALAGAPRSAMAAGLVVIAAGSLVTTARRVSRIAGDLEER